MKISTKIILILSISVIILLLILRLKNPKEEKTSKLQGVYQGKPMEPIYYKVDGRIHWGAPAQAYTKVFYYLSDESGMKWNLVEDSKINDLQKIEQIGNIPMQRDDVHLINGYIQALNSNHEVFFDSFGNKYEVKIIWYNSKGEIDNQRGYLPVRYVRPYALTVLTYTRLDNPKYSSKEILDNYNVPKII